MSIGEICTREVVVTSANTGIDKAAELMRRHHVGDLVVVQESGGGQIPLGIITDRDIVVEVVAAGLDPKALTVGEIMAQELVTGREDDVELVNRSLRDGGHLVRCHWVAKIDALAGALDDHDAQLLCFFPDSLPAAIREKLGVLEPQSLELLDESGMHAGHPGARAGGSHFRLAIVSPLFQGKEIRERHRGYPLGPGGMHEERVGRSTALRGGSTDP